MRTQIKLWMVVWLGAMGGGFLVWYVFDDSYHRGGEMIRSELVVPDNLDETVLMSVGADKITLGDVDFEHQLLSRVVDEDAPLLDNSPVSDSGSHLQSSWHSLRQFILQTLVKRKALFAMIKKDQSFDLKDPEIYRQCYAKIKTVTADLAEFLSQKDYRIKLENRICEAYVIDQYVNQMTADAVITEQMAREYYLSHRSKFSTPERILIRHIHLPSEGEAKRIRRKVRRYNFQHLAQKYSIAPEAAEGGLLGPFAAHEMPSFLSEVFLLKLGRVSPILKSAYGYHIILPLKKYPSQVASFDEVEAKIIAHLRNDQKKQIYENWLHRTLNAVSIVTESYLLQGGSI